jgi:hypothetical protein
MKLLILILLIVSFASCKENKVDKGNVIGYPDTCKCGGIYERNDSGWVFKECFDCNGRADSISFIK